MLQWIWLVWLWNGPLLQTSGAAQTPLKPPEISSLHWSAVHHFDVISRCIFTFSLKLSSLFLSRPTFQLFSWHTCLLGIVSCVVMMFVINPVYSSASIVLLLLLLLFLHYRSPTSSWGYISQALIFHQVLTVYTKTET